MAASARSVGLHVRGIHGVGERDSNFDLFLRASGAGIYSIDPCGNGNVIMNFTQNTPFGLWRAGLCSEPGERFVHPDHADGRRRFRHLYGHSCPGPELSKYYLDESRHKR